MSTLAAKDQENHGLDAEQGRQSTDEGHRKGWGIQCLPCFRLYHQGLLSGLSSTCASWQSLEEESATCQGPQQIFPLLGFWLPGLRAKTVQLVTLVTAFAESSTEASAKVSNPCLGSCFYATALAFGTHLSYRLDFPAWLLSPVLTHHAFHFLNACLFPMMAF